jgi:hypothetical protein
MREIIKPKGNIYIWFFFCIPTRSMVSIKAEQKRTWYDSNLLIASTNYIKTNKNLNLHKVRTSKDIHHKMYINISPA